MYSFPSLNTYLLPSGVETTFTSVVTSNISVSGSGSGAGSDSGSGSRNKSSPL